jgi:hypothetical protein
MILNSDRIRQAIINPHTGRPVRQGKGPCGVHAPIVSARRIEFTTAGRAEVVLLIRVRAAGKPSPLLPYSARRLRNGAALCLGIKLGPEQYDDHGDPYPNHEADHRA